MSKAQKTRKYKQKKGIRGVIPCLAVLFILMVVGGIYFRFYHQPSATENLTTAEKAGYESLVSMKPEGILGSWADGYWYSLYNVDQVNLVSKTNDRLTFDLVRQFRYVVKQNYLGDFGIDNETSRFLPYYITLEFYNSYPELEGTISPFHKESSVPIQYSLFRVEYLESSLKSFTHSRAPDYCGYYAETINVTIRLTVELPEENAPYEYYFSETYQSDAIETEDISWTNDVFYAQLLETSNNQTDRIFVVYYADITWDDPSHSFFAAGANRLSSNTLGITFSTDQHAGQFYKKFVVNTNHFTLQTFSISDVEAEYRNNRLYLTFVLELDAV